MSFMPRIAVLALVVLGSCATSTPDAIEEAFQKVDAAQRPYVTRKQERVPLEPEERDGLESQRLLRPPAEYLPEAGFLPP
jgi:hypothetical protein